MEKAAHFRIVVRRRACCLYACEITEPRRRASETYVGAHIKVKPSIAVGVEEGRAGGPGRAVEGDLSGDIAIVTALIVEKGATLVTRQEQVGAAIIVVIADGTTHPVTL